MALSQTRHARRAVLEVDEMVLGPIARDAHAGWVVLMNASREYTRGVSLERTLDHWAATLADPGLGFTVVANADDPVIAEMAMPLVASGRVVWVAGGMQWRRDSVLCRQCASRVEWPDGDGPAWVCTGCGLSRPVAGLVRRRRSAPRARRRTGTPHGDAPARSLAGVERHLCRGDRGDDGGARSHGRPGGRGSVRRRRPLPRDRARGSLGAPVPRQEPGQLDRGGVARGRREGVPIVLAMECLLDARHDTGLGRRPVGARRNPSWSPGSAASTSRCCSRRPGCRCTRCRGPVDAILAVPTGPVHVIANYTRLQGLAAEVDHVSAPTALHLAVLHPLGPPPGRRGERTGPRARGANCGASRPPWPRCTTAAIPRPTSTSSAASTTSGCRSSRNDCATVDSPNG